MEYEDFYINRIINDLLFCYKHIERNPKYVKSIIEQYCNMSYIKNDYIIENLIIASDICLDNPKKAKNICLTIIRYLKPHEIKENEK